MVELFFIIWLKGKRQTCNTLFRGGRVEVGKGGTLILPKRVCAIEQSMVWGTQVLNRMYNFTKWAVFVLKRVSVWRPCRRTPTQTLLEGSKSLQSKFMSKEVVVNECHACIDLCSVKECNPANELSSMHFQSSKQQDLWKCNINSNIDIVLNENKHGYLRIVIHLFSF